ncbi:MAG: glycosyltransferase family 2 protein [Acidobacteriota bacterium]
MRLSVVVSTYGRRSYIEQCIDSLLAQDRLPDEIVVITRVGDDPTEKYIDELLSNYTGSVEFRRARVTEPGVLAANRAGMRLVSGDIVSFIDDDATAHTDWLSRIEKWFEDQPDVGAVGGRDSQECAGIASESTTNVGRVLWYGRVIGNHHKVSRGARQVDVLKGVNMSFRRHLIPRFDENILGSAHSYEMDLCFAVRHRGYRVIFDGDLLVDHYVNAPRYLAGSTDANDNRREYFIHHNRVYVLLKNLGFWKKLIFLGYTFGLEGIIFLYRLVSGSHGMNPDLLGWIYRGKISGLRDYLFRHRPASSRAGEYGGTD